MVFSPPEIVAFIAIRQWFFAQTLEVYMKSQLDSLLPQAPNDSTTDGSSESQTPLSQRIVHPFTRLHAQYALMGGFTFDTSKVAVQFLPEGRTRLTLTTIALRKLALYYSDLIPDISVEQIREKSKADSFAKSIVCLQALWFIVQVIGRLAARYPISLLEMNTFLHALCCLAIYMAWWNKPLDIQEPSLIDASEDPVKGICAWMVMQSAIGSRLKRHSKSLILSLKNPFYCHLVYEKDVLQGDKNALPRIAGHNERRGSADRNDTDNDVVPLATLNIGTEGHLKLHNGHMVLGFRLIIGDCAEPGFADEYIRLSPANIECMRLAQAFRQEHQLSSDWHFRQVRAYVEIDGNLVVPSASARSDVWQKRTTDISLKSWTFADQKRPAWAWKWLFGNSVDSSLIFGMGLIIACGLYGGGHLLTWNVPLLDEGEKGLWRFSALFLAGTFPTVAVVYLLSASIYGLLKITLATFRKSERVRRWEEMKSSGLQKKLQRFLIHADPFIQETLTFLFTVWCLAYCLARAYLVVESFKGLANLPDKVYEEPEWIQFFAHLSAG
ncbi:Nn.00g048500.m01.CDS01 [Neocucurbitaria sp. VM-36]